MSPLRSSFALLLVFLMVGCDPEAPPPAPPAGTPAPPAPPAPAGAPDTLARLEALQGEVRWEQGGKTVPASEGPLVKGAALETGPDGSVTVRFEDGRTVEVGPNARFVLDEDASGVVLQVARGIVLSRVPVAAPGRPGPRVELRILTPYGFTRVSGQEASEVRVSVGPSEGHVEVRLGTIAFVDKDGGELQAQAGETVSVTAGRAELVARPAKVFELAPIQVTVRADSGRVEVRAQGSERWTVSKGAQPLSPGDGVRVRGGVALLGLEGSASTLALSSGGEMVLEKAGQQGTTDEARVDLRRGALSLRLAEGRDSRVVMPGLTVEAHAAAHVDVRRTSQGLDVASLAGDVVLLQGSNRQPLRAGEQASVAGTGPVKIVALERGPLVLPVETRIQVFHRGLEEVTFDWKEEGDAVVEVATDAEYQRLVLRGLVHQPFLRMPAPARGALYLRVRRPEGTEVVRGSASFAPERAPKELARVTNEVPEGLEKTTIYYQDKPPAVTFTYGSEAQAARYRVQVYRSGALGKPVAERTVSDTRASVEAGVLGEGSFLWSVTPLSQAGKALRGGRMNKLELVYDNSVPVLVVNSPRHGQQAGNRVRATGVAPMGARLSINGRPVTLDSKHRFNTWAEPVGAPPLLLFKMQRAGGPDVYLVRTLK
ncbi:FecR domain-containing protein [Stigmatella aurantiaca]|uniref:Conserved uncharacterized protein n=1 Tax=Stigmatella aurantiaca (strain DW4/3-1) TaxID=378806 RepID=E3FKX9_STIAD|nr:FecR domain-containing protein [Stigmatella aurantiaca]ADO70497.1 conserved uncharacterized protein [Stigmatella aurantiaca DW4/3-1]